MMYHLIQNVSSCLFTVTANEPSVAEVGDFYHKYPLKVLTLNNGKMFIKCTFAPILATLC